MSPFHTTHSSFNSLLQENFSLVDLVWAGTVLGLDTLSRFMLKPTIVITIPKQVNALRATPLGSSFRF